MRRRITRTLLAAAAAGVPAGTLGLTAVGAANAAVSHTASGNIGPTMATTSFVITPRSTSGPVEYYKTRAYGPIFDHAAALDDFTNSTGVPIALPPFVQAFRINQFLQGALTTYSGSRGSFIGKWTTSAVIATRNGLLPPPGTTRVSPTPLWSDGLAANNEVRLWDAFGVWAR